METKTRLQLLVLASALMWPLQAAAPVRQDSSKPHPSAAAGALPLEDQGEPDE